MKREVAGTKKGVVRSVREEKRKREKKKGKGVFHLSLRSTKIEPSVFVGARIKVDLHFTSYV